MGIISKQIHQRTTNRLAQPTRAVTKLDIDQVLEVLRRVIDQRPPKTGLLQTGQKLWFGGQPPGPWNVYYGPPSRKEPGKVVAVWTSHVGLKSSSSGTETISKSSSAA